MRKSRVALGGALLCGCLASLALVVMTASGADAPSPPHAIASSGTRVRSHRVPASRRPAAVRRAETRAIQGSARVSVSASLRQKFHVFALRHGHSAGSTSTDRLPVRVAAGIASNGFAVNVMQAVKVPSGGGVWLVPGNNAACIVGNGPAFVTACAPLTGTPGAAESGGLLFTDSAAKGEAPDSIVGLAPDGNTRVTLRLSDGSTKTVPVMDNVYVLHQSNLASVTLASADGADHTIAF